MIIIIANGIVYFLEVPYNPNTGRFTRRDDYQGRLGEPLTLHKYIYANGNPVSFTDPSGFYSIAESSAAFSIESTLAATAYIMFTTKSYQPERLSGFGEDERPRTILDGLLAWRNTWAPETLGGFSEGSQPTASNHTGNSSRDINDLIRYVFTAELSNLDRHWHPGSFDSPQDSFDYHYEKHGYEVGAKTPEQYLNKADEFSKNLRRAQSYYVDGAVDGAKRYVKNGRYIDMAPDKRIISFGSS